MTRLCSLILCAALGLVACGSNTSSTGNGGNTGNGGSSGNGGSTASTKSALDVVPGDNTVSGWKVDSESNKNANPEPMTATTAKEVQDLIDGGGNPYFIAPYAPKLFVWQNYINSTLTAPKDAHVALYVLQMPSADQASGIYAAVLQTSEYDRKKGTPDDWKPPSPTVGDESRIQDDGSHWWINFHKGVFYVEIKLDPSTGPAPDYTPSDPNTEKEAVRFAQAVADKI